MPRTVTIFLFNDRTYRSKLVSHLLWSLLILSYSLSFLHFKFEVFFSLGRVYLQSVSIKMSSQHAPHFHWGYDGKLSSTAGVELHLAARRKLPFLSVFQILAFTLASTFYHNASKSFSFWQVFPLKLPYCTVVWSIQLVSKHFIFHSNTKRNSLVATTDCFTCLFKMNSHKRKQYKAVKHLANT